MKLKRITEADASAAKSLFTSDFGATYDDVRALGLHSCSGHYGNQVGIWKQIAKQRGQSPFKLADDAVAWLNKQGNENTFPGMEDLYIASGNPKLKPFTDFSADLFTEEQSDHIVWSYSYGGKDLEIWKQYADKFTPQQVLKHLVAYLENTADKYSVSGNTITVQDVDKWNFEYLTNTCANIAKDMPCTCVKDGPNLVITIGGAAPTVESKAVDLVRALLED